LTGAFVYPLAFGVFGVAIATGIRVISGFRTAGAGVVGVGGGFGLLVLFEG